jgi:hypothetical protein
VASAMRVLDGYGSRFGSTQEIAIRIAKAIRTNGSDVDVRSAEEIVSFNPYEALCSAVGSTTSRGRQRRRNFSGVTPSPSRANQSGSSAWAPLEIDIR